MSVADAQMRERQRRMQEVMDDRERQIERHRREERESREAKEAAARAKQATSPRASSTANPSANNPYPRPSLPPSPTNSRNLGVPASASPASSAKPSPSIPTAGAPATSSSQRPNLPLPSLSSIGGRSLPSPFDAQPGRPPASGTQPTGPGSAHHRTGSTGSAAAKSDPAGSLSAHDPMRPGGIRPQNAPPASSSTTGGAQSSNPPYGARPGSSVAGRYPGSTPAESDAARAAGASAAAKPGATASTAASVNRPPARDHYGGNYPFSNGGFMSFGGGFDYNSFGGWTSRRPMSERERLAKEQKDMQEERRKAAERDARAAREKADAAAAKRAEEMRAEDAAIARRNAAAAGKPAPAGASTATASYDPYRHTDTALQQVAPRREPRPYEYKTDSKDYQYTPRDKRPRMDAAVDDARRGNATKSRRRKDEGERAKSPPQKLRDYSHLTAMVRSWPEVHSTGVESWLKSFDDPGVVASDTYTGNKYRMSQHRKRHTPGGLVQVRIGGGFLGQRWKLRGEVGWDEATPTPSFTLKDVAMGGGEVSAGWEDRGVWGTDVYTDDSDLGLVLVHAGWIKWGGPPTSDTDSVIVDVRIVPPLVRYYATERGGMRSRNWGNGHDGSSIVVEAVRRVPIDKQLLAGRKNRKRRLAEYALQRDHVLGLDSAALSSGESQQRVPLGEDVRRLNGVYDLDEPIFTLERDGAAYRYNPTAFAGMLVRDEEDGVADSLWTKDLELDRGADRYRLSLLPSDISSPLLRLVHTPLHSTSTKQDENTRSVVFDNAPPSSISWTEDGLVFWATPAESEDAARGSRTPAQLCRVSGYRWVQRENEWKVDKVIKVDEGAGAAGGEGAAMEVDPA